jgi:hypothetical protein
MGGPRPSSATDRTVGASGPSSPIFSEKPRQTRFESSPGQIEAAHSKDSTNTTHANSNNLFFREFAEVLDFFQNMIGTTSELEGRLFVHQVQPLNCFRTRPNNNGMQMDPPIRLLSRCHTLSVAMACLGFILALLGILVFAWTTLPTSVSVFSSISLGGCILAVFVVMTCCG